MILSLFVYKINKQKEEMPILFHLCTVFLYSCDQIHILGVVLIMVLYDLCDFSYEIPFGNLFPDTQLHLTFVRILHFKYGFGNMDAALCERIPLHNDTILTHLCKIEFH